MEFDAFTGGVAPGGLRSKSDIRILICYLLKSVDAPLSGEDIIRVMQEKALANYFEVNDALSALVSLGNIRREEDGTYVLEPQGKSVADNLDVLLPLSVRDKAIAAAMSMLASAKIERENAVTTTRTDNGYNVSCHMKLPIYYSISHSSHFSSSLLLLKKRISIQLYSDLIFD